MVQFSNARTAFFGSLVAYPLLISTGQSTETDSLPAESDLALMDAVTWGATSSTVSSFQTLGREKWLQGQLHPDPAHQLPQAAQEQIDALDISNKSVSEVVRTLDVQRRAIRLAKNQNEKAEAKKIFRAAMDNIARQAATASIINSLYSQDQLLQRMTWFWFNHFNVFQNKADIRLLIGDYESVAVRPRAMGRFRDLLMATVRHPAMIRYLDNAENAVGHLNENYAREIIELHTMGIGSGYSQKDVEELARILTGIGIQRNGVSQEQTPEPQRQIITDGLFEFDSKRHDFGNKIFLGQRIHGRGLAEVEQAIDILCKQPATASHIARRIAIYFVSDDPPQTLVDRLSRTFQKTDGDIAAVLDTLFHSHEFDHARGNRFKDPVKYVLSAVRLAYDGMIVSNTAPIQKWLDRLGEGLYKRQTPDGYPMVSSSWNGPGQMMTRFEIAHNISSTSVRLFEPKSGDVSRSALPSIKSGAYFDTLKLKLKPSTLATLNGAASPQDWNMLFLSSPEFMY